MAADILGTSPDIDLRKRWALMQLQNASNGAPQGGGPLAAIARSLQGALGGYSAYQAEEADKAAGASLFGGSGSLPGLGTAPQAPPSAPSIPASPQSSPYAGAISNIESGGNYGALGPVTKSGDRAYGKYQIMGANVGPWTKQYLGQEMTPQEFAQDKIAQDKVFNGKFGSYADKYGPEGAARAWFAGEGGMNNPNAKDQLGTSVQDYARKFNAGMGQQPFQTASLGANPGMPAAPQMPPDGLRTAQAGGPQPINPPAGNRSSVQIPPDVQASIQRLGADPRTRPQAMQLYMQYAKPVETYRQGVDPKTGIPFQQNTMTGKREADPTKVDTPNSVKEYQYYKDNLPSGSEPMDYATFSTAKARAGATNISNNVDMNSGQAYDKLLAEGLGKSHAALSNGVEESQARARDIAAMQGAIDTIQKNGGTTGGLGQAQIQELKKTVNAGANAIGITTPFNENDISDKEFLQKFNRAMAGAQAKGAVGSRVTNFELGNFLKANPGLDMSITGNQRLLGIQSQIEQRNIAVGNAIREATASAISKGQKIDPVTVQKIVASYDTEHHISDPVNGQDLTQSYALPEFQKSDMGANSSMAVGHEQNINGIKIKRVK